MEKLLEAQGLVKRYNGRAVVDHVSFSVGAGEAVGMLGPNGAGKTTAFRICIGMIKPAAGSVVFNGTEVTRFPMHQRCRLGMSYLAQEPSLFQAMSVEHNLTAIMEMQGIGRAARDKKAREMLGEFGLTALRDQPAFTLSGGERRRLEIARALCGDPKIMLLDEPFTGIDPIAVSDVQNMVVGLKYRGIGVLITDHNVLEALRITDRAYILSEGRIVAQGSAEQILADPVARKSYLGNRIRAEHLDLGNASDAAGSEAPDPDST